MAAVKFLALLVLILTWALRPAGDGLDGERRVQMWLRERRLEREMTRLLREIEQEQSALHLRSQEQSGFVWWALQQWQLWAVAAALLLLCGLCRRLRKRSCQPAISRKEGSSGNRAQKMNREERASVARVVPGLSAMVEDLVHKLLHNCQRICCSSSVPQLQPATVMEYTSEGCGMDDHVYQVLVPIRPPRGHTFHLELCSEEEMPVGTYRLRVELECTCTQHMLCFLHHPEEELEKHQAPSLLDILCTGPYLDMDKTYFWFQMVLNVAWELLPESRHCRLMVLASRHSCKLRLSYSSYRSLLINMTLGVQQGDSDTFTSIEQPEV